MIGTAFSWGRRSDNHRWVCSGGAVEIDEYVEDCAKRELHEEMGLMADELEFFSVNSGPNGDAVSNFEIVYMVISVKMAYTLFLLDV